MIYSSLVIAQDTLTAVAVGEAETEKEKIYFETSLKKKDLNAAEEKKLELIGEVLKSDFDFYRSRFEIQDNKSNETKYRKHEPLTFCISNGRRCDKYKGL